MRKSLLTFFMLLCVAMNAMASWVKCTAASDFAAGEYYMFVTTAKYGNAYYYLPAASAAVAKNEYSKSGGAGTKATDDATKLGLAEAGWKLVSTSTAGQYKLQSAANANIYLYTIADNNGVAAGEASAASSYWTIAKNSNAETFKFTYNLSTTRDLSAYASSPYGFRAYVSTSTNGVHYLTVYKYVASSVATPTISIPTGTYENTQSVTITQEGSKTIYYTVDGSNPTTSSTAQVYSSAITVSETTTIKAAAKDGDNWSDVAVSTITIKKVYNTLADLLADVNKFTSDTPINLKTDGLVVSGIWKSGNAENENNAFLTDNNGNGIQLYQSKHGFKVGDKLSGTASTKVVKYNTSGIAFAELKELTSTTTGLTVTEGQTVEVKNMSLSELAPTKNGVVAKFTGLTYNSEKKTLTSGTDTITPYGTFITLPTLYDGATYDVTGVIVVQSSIYEIAPRTAEDIVNTSTEKVPSAVWKIDGKAVSVDTLNIGATSSASFITDSEGAKTFTTSDASVATVSETGVITAVAVGTATITATTAKTSEHLKGVATITIKVIDASKDVLTIATTGVESNYTSWAGKKDGSGAIYAGNTSRYTSNGSNAIQIRNNDQTPSGIVVTASEKYASKITLVFNEGTVSPQNASANIDTTKNYRQIMIYTKSTAYESPADLYNDAKKGTLVGSITNKSGNGAQSFTFTKNENKYFGLLSTSNGASYFDKIIIEWSDTALGIKEVQVIEGADIDAVYNLAGQRVSKDTKGIVIIGGKKVLNK